MSLHKSSDNTHEIYGRNNTRSFETDSSKDGFERVETYHRDVYGRIIRTDNDALNTAAPIDSHNTYSHNPYNQVVERREYQTNGKLTKKSVSLYDAYGKATSVTTYSSEDQKSNKVEYKFDQYGRQIYRFEDKNANDTFDVGDLKVESFYNEKGLLAERIDQWINKDGKSGKNHIIYSHDEFNRLYTSFIDKDGDKQLSQGEVQMVRHYFGESSVVDYYDEFKDSVKIKSTKIVYPDAGENGVRLMGIYADSGQEYNRAAYGFDGFHNASKDDYTSANWQALFTKYGGHIARLVLTNEKASTEITLDNDVIALLSKEVADKTLTIQGDATDKVFIKEMSDFTKQSDTVSKNGQVYDKYTTQVDSQDYTVLIDTDITVMGV